MKTFASRFQLLMARTQSNPFYVRLNDQDEYGLYFSTNFRNDLGLPLAARGTLEDLKELVSELSR